MFVDFKILEYLPITSSGEYPVILVNDLLTSIILASVSVITIASCASKA